MTDKKPGLTIQKAGESGTTFGSAREETTPPTKQGSSEKPFCYHFMKGKCNKGDKCFYNHSIPDENQMAELMNQYMQGGPAPGKKKDKDCTFFLQGKCLKGDDCDFRHGKPTK